MPKDNNKIFSENSLLVDVKLKETFPDEDLYAQAKDGAIAGMSFLILSQKGQKGDAIEGLLDAYEENQDFDSPYWEGVRVAFKVFDAEHNYEKIQRQLPKGEIGELELKTIISPGNDKVIPKGNIMPSYGSFN